MYVLPRNRYGSIVLDPIPFNHYFARSVIEHHLKGTVFVDDVKDPRTCLILHPYGLSLLYGEEDNEEFNGWLKDHMLNPSRRRSRHEWLQVYPHSWNDKFKEMLGSRLVDPQDPYEPINVEEHSRVNFEFDPNEFSKYRPSPLPDGFDLVRIDETLFDSIEGLVIPKSFWDNSDDFLDRGIGFCVMKDDEIISWSFTAWIHGRNNEIGIETSVRYRGMGFAVIPSVEFIRYCLKNGYDPVWTCRYENQGSYKLALKLGFKETRRIPFYRLCE